MFLLFGSFISTFDLVSANDAANVIAEQIAGSQDAFVEMMNQEAQKIGATNTHFVNANGLLVKIIIRQHMTCI